jgi:hypothetical protein
MPNEDLERYEEGRGSRLDHILFNSKIDRFSFYAKLIKVLTAWPQGNHVSWNGELSTSFCSKSLQGCRTNTGSLYFSIIYLLTDICLFIPAALVVTFELTK